MTSASVELDTLRGRAAGAARRVRRLLREATGESRWDDYLARCRAESRTPMSRREFERHRADHRERSTQPRCC